MPTPLARVLLAIREAMPEARLGVTQGEEGSQLVTIWVSHEDGEDFLRVSLEDEPAVVIAQVLESLGV